MVWDAPVSHDRDAGWEPCDDGSVRKVMALGVLVLVLTGCGEAATPEPSPTPTASARVELDTPSPTPSATPTRTPTPTPTPEPAADWDLRSADSLQVLVNKRTPLQPADYVPSLVAVSSAQEGGETVRPEVDAALAELSAAMRADIGEGTFVFSSYRSFDRQTQLYNGYVAQYGQAEADTTSARPGHSEHQTGLAVDVSGTGGACRLDVCFGDTAAGRWIAEHAWEHGFIVRYPEGLEGITGYEYEPWHLRFVGTEISTAMHEQGARTYEEFLGLPAAPDYG